MAIPSRQIGWGVEENLLYEISKQLEALTGVISKIGQGQTTTTTSTTTIPTVNVGISPFSNCGQIVQTLPVVLTGDFCATTAPYPTITGDFSNFQVAEFYVLYNGQSRTFTLETGTLAVGFGGGPGECVNCSI